MIERARFESNTIVGIILRGNGGNNILLNTTNCMADEEKIKMLESQIGSMEILDSVVVANDGDSVKIPAEAEL